MQLKKERSSNMELLRIIAMVMIVVFHIFMHKIIPQASRVSEAYPYFETPRFSPRIALLSLFNSFGVTGNGIFILISGYFMADRDAKSIDLGKTTKKLLLQFGFGTAVLCVASMICSRLITSTYIPIITDQYFNTDLWFIGYYLVIILFSKLFLNDLLRKMERERYAAFLIVLFAVTQLAWARGLIDGFNARFSTLFTGLFLYTFAGYIRRYNPFGRVRLGVWLLGLAAIYLLLLVSVYGKTQTVLQQSIWNQKKFVHSVRAYGDFDLMCILAAIAWFELFRRLRISKSKIVNFLGQSMFMVYIIHENDFFHALWDLTNWQPIFYDAPLTFCGALIKWTAVSFLAGTAAYAAFLGAEKLVHKYGWIILKKEQDTPKS